MFWTSGFCILGLVGKHIEIQKYVLVPYINEFFEPET